MAVALKGKQIFPLIRVEDKDTVHFAVNCRHCGVPYCAKGCITGALTIEDGVIILNQDKCIGCYTCILSCPYGAIMPAEDGAVVQKCELCLKLNTEPQCVKNCPNAAIVYEDRG
jgi:carbon-monoxide dehydrogenase iron sulfur subunit